MVLSNAERQARYRQRLKDKAAGVQLPEQAHKAADAAIAALWTFYNRPTDDGRRWGDADDFATVEAFATGVAACDGGLIGYCRSHLHDPEGLLPEEVEALRTIVRINDAITLADLRPAKPSRGKR